MGYPTIGSEQQNFQRGVFTGQITSENKLMDFLTSQGLLSAYHGDITPEVAQRGGEDGMPGQTVDVAYLQWPATSFLALPFLHSIEPEVESQVENENGNAGHGNGSLGFFHVTVLRKLRHAYLLHAFASHLLAPDRATLTSNKQLQVPPVKTYWTVVVDEGADSNEAVREVAICVRAALQLEA